MIPVFLAAALELLHDRGEMMSFQDLPRRLSRVPRRLHSVRTS